MDWVVQSLVDAKIGSFGFISIDNWVSQVRFHGGSFIAGTYLGVFIGGITGIVVGAGLVIAQSLNP